MLKLMEYTEVIIIEHPLYFFSQPCLMKEAIYQFMKLIMNDEEPLFLCSFKIPWHFFDEIIKLLVFTCDENIKDC